jgi:hemerythrin-like domain-containing protein
MAQPIKRHIALQPLSREHHFGLLLCWKIRTGFSKGVAADRIKAYADWFYSNHLVPHFEMEEAHIFPVLGNEHELVQQALNEHKRLHSLFHAQEDSQNVLSDIEEELEKHIRFEERVLFNEIQKVATPEQLQERERLHTDEPFTEAWEDKFWV